MERQSETGGFFSVKDAAPTTVNSGDAWKRQEEEEKAEEKAELDEKYGLTAQLKHQSIAARHLATGCLTPLPFLPIPVHPSSPPPPARISFAVLHLEHRLTNPSSLVDLLRNISTDLSQRPQSLQLSPVFPKSAVDHDDWKAKEMVRRTGTRARLQREKTRVQRQALLNIKVVRDSSQSRIVS